MLELTILPEAEKKNSSRKAKTRQFSATYVGHLVANNMMAVNAEAETTRPAWLMFTAPEQAMRPFVANLQAGRQAGVDDYRDPLLYSDYGSKAYTRFELLKSAGYRYLWQRISGTRNGTVAVVTAYIPDLFVLDPGMIDPAGVTFISMPPLWWSEQELAKLDRATLRSAVNHARALPNTSPARKLKDEQLVALLPAATYACAMLEKRTTRPMIASYEFYLQLYLRGVAAGVFMTAREAKAGVSQSYNENYPADFDTLYDWAPSSPTWFAGHGLKRAGVCTPVACRASHAQIDQLLAEETATYFDISSDINSGQRAA